MKTKNILKHLQIAIGILMILVSINGVGHAVVVDETKGESAPTVNVEQIPQYAPGEVLVKFKEGADPSSILKEGGIESQGIERIHSIKPAVAKFRKDYKLEKDPKGGWYSFLGKQYKEVSDIPDEEMFKEAYKSMSETEKSLYRSYKVELPEGMSVEEAIRHIRANPNVEYTEPNRIVKIQMIPNDQYYNTRPDQNRKYSWGQPYDDLWGIKKIQCEQAWDISQGEGVIVAVIDTGVDYNHPDLAANIWTNEDEIPNNGIDDDKNGFIDDVRGWDFAITDDGEGHVGGNDNDPMDGHGHGTHTSGTIAAVGNNNLGVIGVAPKAKIMAVKGLGDNGSGDVSDLANCVIYAADNGAKVLSNSWGGSGPSQTLAEAFYYAYYKGCVCVAAAGNNYGADTSGFTPAGIDTVIAVSASTPDDQLCDFSNIGKKIDVAAPGGDSATGDGPDGPDTWRIGRNILSLRAQGTDMYGMSDPDYDLPAGICLAPQFNQTAQYYRARGTSMACPHVAGVVALILSKYPNLTAEDVRDRLRFSSDDIGDPGKDVRFGYGRINAYMALNLQMSMHSDSGNNFYHRIAAIKGTAAMEKAVDFDGYELYYAPKDNPSDLTFIASSHTMIKDGVLGVWDTRVCAEGASHILVLKVIDKNKKEHMFTKEVVVDNVNEPPVFSSLGNKGAVKGKLLTFKVEASDPDDPATAEGQMIFSASNLPAGATFDADTQIFSWQQDDSNKGTYIVRFDVRDSNNVRSQDVTICTVAVTDSEPVKKYLDLSGGWLARGDIDIFNDKIVFVGREGQVCMHNLTTGITIEITKNYEWVASNAAIYDDMVAFMTIPFALNLYYIKANSRVVMNQGVDFAEKCRAYGSRVAWVNLGGSSQFFNFDRLLFYDIANSKCIVVPIRVFSRDAFHWISNFDICDDKIVYNVYDTINDNPFFSSIQVYDILTGKIDRVTDYDLPRFSVSMYGRKIVWSENALYRGGTIFIYDLDTKLKQQISYLSRACDRPRIYGDKVVWLAEDGLYYYDPKHGEILISLDLAEDYQVISLDIHRDGIVYISSHRGDNDNPKVHLVKLSFSPIIDSVNPTVVLPGDAITISGADFGSDKGTSKITFGNGVEATAIDSWSDIRIICHVPEDAQSGPVTVTTANGTSNGIYIKRIVLPLAPTSLIGSFYGPKSALLRWQDNSDNEDNFIIKRNGSILKILPKNQAFFLDSSVVAGNTYTYAVFARNKAGDSANSNSVSIVIPVVPLKPTDLKIVSAYKTRVTIGWRYKHADETGFAIKRTDNNGSVIWRYVPTNSTVPVGTTILPGYFDREVTPGAIYKYVVYAYNLAGMSLPSNEVRVIVPRY